MLVMESHIVHRNRKGRVEVSIQSTEPEFIRPQIVDTASSRTTNHLVDPLRVIENSRE